MREKLTEFVAGAAGNFISEDWALSPELAGQRIYDAPVLGVADARDPLFAGLKESGALGPWFRLPEEWLPGAKRVISFFLPYSRAVKLSNGPGPEPSLLWLHGRMEGQNFLLEAGRWLQKELEKDGCRAVIPGLSAEYRSVEKAREPGGPSFTSNWSERHVAFVCGLGTFGLSGNLITEKGVCGRFGSLVTTAPLPVTERRYTAPFEYCTRCGACIRRCPAGAITEAGKTHAPCQAYLAGTWEHFAPYYGCGKCQVLVPCADGIPSGN